MNDNFQHDFGLSEMEGIAGTAQYYIRTISPSGKIFNFANSGGTLPDTNPIYFFYSRHFNQPEVATFYRQLLSERIKHTPTPHGHFFLSIPWYDAAFAPEAALPKLQVYRGINDIAVLSGDRKISDFIYLIAKTGDPDMAHQHLDVGTFIVETNGVRWSDDLGADNYKLPGFWDYKPDGRRWDYFRNTNFSHNTLSIDHKLQYSAGIGEVDTFDDKTAQPFVTMNLSTVYTDQAKAVYRTFQLLDDTHIMVTDSVELLSPNQLVQWSVITAADIECEGNKAILSKDGQSFLLKIVSHPNAVFAKREAKPFTSLGEYPIEGYHVLSANVTGQKKQVIKVLMTSDKIVQ
jgi:hypothetical protein